MKSSSLQNRNGQNSHHDGRATTAERRFPQTDYHYQSTPRASAAALAASHPSLANYEPERRSFREICEPISGSRFDWQFATEAALLGVISAIAAWPLFSLLILLAQTAGG